MHRDHDFNLRIAAAIAVFFGCTGACAGQDLPPGATWSDEPLPFPTVAQTFAELSKQEPPRLSRDKTFVSFNIRTAPLHGFWEFSGGSVTTEPTRYWRYNVVPGKWFTAKVSWACDASKPSCEQFRTQIAGQLPPSPPMAPPALRSAAGSSGPIQPAEVRDPSKPQRDPAPKRLVTPEVPSKFACTQFHATADVVVDVDADGHAVRAVIDKGSGDEDLDKAAIDAASRSAFQPGISNGHPVPARVRIPYAFDNANSVGSKCRVVTGILLDAQRAGSVAQTNDVPIATYAPTEPVKIRIDHVLPKGTELIVRCVNVGVVEEVDFSTDATPVSNVICYPAGGWEPGHYHVELTDRDVLIGWARFDVREP
jgi:TonB family protein